MGQIQKQLKLNEFKKNNLFDSSTFGLLSLNEYFDDKLVSQILNLQQTVDLIKTCGFSQNDKFNLLYQGNRDGFTAEAFHSKCDGHANTLTIIKPTNSPNIFGGFTSATWDSVSKFKLDPNAFIFSLINEESQIFKMKVKHDHIKNAIYCDSGYGPQFGYDIQIYYDQTDDFESCSNLG